MLDKRQFYINGEWVNPAQANDLEVINPSNEVAYATISLGSETDTNAAVAAAQAAFWRWAETPRDERLALVEKFAAIYKARMAEMGETISQEMGAPIDKATGAQAGSGLWHIKGFIREFKQFQFEHPLNADSPDHIVAHEPIGVCGLITPWNWPMNQVALKVIPAVAVGCTVVLKPSEIAPLSSMLFAEMMHEAGFPPGVFNLVNGDGVGVGSQLSAHPDIDMVSFTGSTRAGTLISKSAADTIKRVSLELGGKSANLVFADADADAVSRGVIDCFGNTGQSCNAPTRMLVEHSYYDEAVAIAKKTAEDTLVDISEKRGSHLGPLVSDTHFERVQGLIQAGIDEGARLVAGGVGKPEGLETGYFVRPTVFADVNNEMTIAREEVFGPVLAMIPFESEEDAVRIANDTVYGLSNYVQTQDMEKANRVARRLRSGMVHINGEEQALCSPFGGYKQSGNGREGGKWGLEDFLEVKLIHGGQLLG